MVLKRKRQLKKIQPYLQCIVLTGHGAIDTALESGKHEAFKYLLKPIEYDTLVDTIKKAYEHKVQIQDAKFREEVDDIHKSGLGSRGIKKAMDRLRKIYGID